MVRCADGRLHYAPYDCLRVLELRSEAIRLDGVAVELDRLARLPPIGHRERPEAQAVRDAADYRAAAEELRAEMDRRRALRT